MPLDTHVALWAITDSPRLPAAVRVLIAAPPNLRASDYRMVPVEAEHVVAVVQLPPHHQDPFDQLWVAQPLRRMSHDAQMARYSDTVIAG